VVSVTEKSRELARAASSGRRPGIARGVCLHCGLDLPERAELGLFCCAGCKNVHELLKSEGLERYYDLRGATDAPPPELREDGFLWLDPWLKRAVPGPGGTLRLSLDVQGVHCAACVWLLQELFARQPGALELRVNPAVGRAEFLWIENQLDLRDYLRTVLRFGYRFGPQRKQASVASRGLLVRFCISLAAALNTMVFSLCYYLGLAPLAAGPDGDGGLYAIFGRWNFALCTVAVLVGGSLFMVSAWRGLRRGVAHLDLPIATGILLGYGGSVWAWLARGPEAAYFDTITIFVSLMVLGRWLQERVLEKNRLSLLASDGVDDLFARRRRGDQLATIPAAEIAVGDELWIPPGDLVPVASTVLGERATMSLAWITGESRARGFEPGETVPAGAFHTGESSARVAALEPFAASRLHTLLGPARLLQDEAGPGPSGAPRPAPLAGGNRFATLYVACVLILAAAGFVLWSSSGFERAIEVALSILVVTCPCALGLAMPLAHELVHVALRRRGIFLRETDFLARVLSVRHVLFDKTGTLTRGTLELGRDSREALSRLDPQSRRVLAHMTAQSLHPVSRAIHAALSPSGASATPLVAGLSVREFPGRGLEARLEEQTWRLGSAPFALPAQSQGRTGTCLSLDGTALAEFSLEEVLKSDAREEVQRLEAQGLEVHLLSGDRPERVRRVAGELGIDPARVHGGLSPEDKARCVRALDRSTPSAAAPAGNGAAAGRRAVGQGDTWMVGDGINDGPAFDAAWCASTPAVDRPNLPARAGMFYLGDGVSAVRVTREYAARLWSVLRTNLWLSSAYNLCAVAACLCGFVGPLTAAVLMPASSLGFLGLTYARLSPRSSP
jgi:Cu2+-exporting ATPase